jgi:hypothetical protein
MQERVFLTDAALWPGLLESAYPAFLTSCLPQNPPSVVSRKQPELFEQEKTEGIELCFLRCVMKA